MFKKRSKVLFVCALLATIYVIYLVCHFSGSISSSNSDAETAGSVLATALVTPHMIMTAMGALFSWLGFFLRKSWAALVGAILYCVGLVLFFVYFMFSTPLIILGFVGYSKQKKINNVSNK